MPLVCKGTAVSFRRVGSGEVRATGAMLHDASGKAWPKCSLLFASFEKTNANVALTDDADYWLGEDYQALRGKLVLPPRDLQEWREIAQVKMIYYTRTGIRHPGPFKHPFGVQRKHFFFRGEKPILYRCERTMRLELQSGCVISDLGLVWP